MPLGRIISGTLPYVAIMALALALVAVFPQLGLYPHRSPDGMVVGFKSPRSANVYLGQNLPEHDGALFRRQRLHSQRPILDPCPRQLFRQWAPGRPIQ